MVKALFAIGALSVGVLLANHLYSQGHNMAALALDGFVVGIAIGYSEAKK